MALLLSKSEVVDLMNMRRAIECTEAVFREQAQGGVQAWAPFAVSGGGSELRVNAGFLSSLGAAGLRVGMGGGSQILLYDVTGKRLACVMAYPFSYLRVGATVGLALDRLARRDARRLLVIGTGRIARVSFEAIACLRRFQRVQVYSRKAANRDEFCRTAKGRFGVDAEAVDDLEPAVRAADAVVVATNASAPVLRAAWLSEGTHVSTAGIRHEVDADVYLRAELVIVASREQEQGFIASEGTDNILLRLISEGRLNWRAIPELGEIVAQRIARPQGISVFRESQGGFGDLILAKTIYEQAKALGLGRTVSFDE